MARNPPQYLQLKMIYPNGPVHVDVTKREVSTDNLNYNECREFGRQFVDSLLTACQRYHTYQGNQSDERIWFEIREKLATFLINRIDGQLLAHDSPQLDDNTEAGRWLIDICERWNDLVKKAEKDGNLKDEVELLVKQKLQPKGIEILNGCLEFKLTDCESPVQKLFAIENGKPVWHYIARMVIKKAISFVEEEYTSHEARIPNCSEETLKSWREGRADVLKIFEHLTEFSLGMARSNLIGHAEHNSFEFTITPTSQLHVVTDNPPYDFDMIQNWGLHFTLIKQLRPLHPRGHIDEFITLADELKLTNLVSTLKHKKRTSGMSYLKREFHEGEKLDAHLSDIIWRRIGYDWNKDRFGPEPGIEYKEMKDLDEMGDVDYHKEVMSWGEDKQLCIMCCEEERRRSFRNNYEQEDFIRGVDFASAGFYYIGREREKPKVKCAFCKIVVDDWVKGEKPMKKHKAKNTDCPFVQGKALHNIPFDVQGVSALDSKHISRAYVPDRKQMMELNLWESPKKPEFRTYKSRIDTFQKRWPEILKSLKERLADTGFYFTYEQDKVKCYYCDGFLIGWEKYDKPWLEHAKWYPKCALVLQYKGFNFTARAQDYFQEWEVESYQEVYNEKPMGLKKASRQEMLLARCQAFPLFEVARQLPDLKLEKISNAYSTNGYREFQSIDHLLNRIYDIEDQKIHSEVQGSAPKAGEIMAVDKEMEKQKRIDKDLIALASCIKCRSRQLEIVLIDCGHFVLCKTCFYGVKDCPECSSPVLAHIVPDFGQ